MFWTIGRKGCWLDGDAKLIEDVIGINLLTKTGLLVEVGLLVKIGRLTETDLLIEVGWLILIDPTVVISKDW